MKRATAEAIGKGFFSLADVYVAYRKAKVEAYYENTHFHAIAFTEYEQNLQNNLANLLKTLEEPKPEWPLRTDFLGEFAYLPKSVDCSVWENGSDGHFKAIDPRSEWRQRFSESRTAARAKFRLVIRPSVDFQIISALWIMKVGHLFDGVTNSRVSFGNRLRRSHGEVADLRVPLPPLNSTATGLFAPYFSAYRNWREQGLSKMESSLREEKNILAITMDIEQFYHRVSPRFLLRPSFLDAIGIRLTKDEKAFTTSLLKAIECWYQSTPDFLERPDGAIPVGLSASKIISNVLLNEFDNQVLTRLKPIYYGRYVDDLFFVFENNDRLTSASEVTAWFASNLSDTVSVVAADDQSPSLRLRLPYAKDSLLLFTGKKQKIFALSSSHGLDLIQHIRDQIREQSSEYRLLPSVPETGTDMASKALLATPDASLQVDALRKADAVSVRRLGFSLLLRDIEAYSADLRPESWTEIREEFYGLVRRHILTPHGFFDFVGYIPRIFGLMLSCHDLSAAKNLIEDLVDLGRLIETTTTAIEEAETVKLRLCLGQYTRALLQAGVQAATERTIEVDSRYLSVLRKLKRLDASVRIPSSVDSLKRRVRQMLLADWGRRPYKDYWYLSQDSDEHGPPVPRNLQVRKKLRLGGIRRFRENWTDLKVPHWPALAFPTRPLRVDEIALVAPNTLTESELLEHAIMVLRGAKVARPHGFGFTSSKDSPGGETGLFLAPGRAKQKIRVALTSYQTTAQQWKLAALGRQDRSAERYAGLNGLLNRILREARRPDYIVFPELSMPLRWGLRIARKLALNDVSLLTGVEYHKDRATRKLRNDCLLSLTTRWPGYLTNVVLLQTKFAPSHGEKQELRKLLGKRKDPLSPPKPPLNKVHRGIPGKAARILRKKYSSSR
jgi:hypothetical protein